MMSFFEGDVIVNVVNITLSMIVLFIVFFLNLLELNLSCSLVFFFSAGESHAV